MALQLFEILKNVGNFFTALGNASKPSSDGGKVITKKELLNAGVNLVQAFGIDVVDNDEE